MKKELAVLEEEKQACWPTLMKKSGNSLNYTTLTVIPYGK